jgi:hypothetical protein
MSYTQHNISISVIQITSPDGEVFSVSVEFFLKYFFSNDYKFLPPGGRILYDDLDNLKQLFVYLRESSIEELYIYFLRFHAWNLDKIPGIYWELLNV